MSNNNIKIFALLSVVLVWVLSACSVPQQTIYFKNNTPTDSTVLITKIPPYKQSRIAPDDILAIKISSISDFTTKDPVSIFNDGGIEYALTPTTNNGGGAGGTSAGGIKGYLVDPHGEIDFPVIGKMPVAGKTLREVKDMISQKLRENYVKDPVVEVRILNYKVTVMGEVRYPGVVIAPNHRMNVLEAVAAAGDITSSGRKDNILIMREHDGIREFARVNLNSRNSFTNPFFYLKQNDIVYVESSRVARQEGNNSVMRFYLPFASAILSSIVAIILVKNYTK
jgi:polysaccharide export outer membrane protein